MYKKAGMISVKIIGRTKAQVTTTTRRFGVVKKISNHNSHSGQSIKKPGLVPGFLLIKITQIGFRCELQKGFIHQPYGLLDITFVQHLHSCMHVTQRDGN